MLLCYITDRKSFTGSESEQRVALLRCIADAARAQVDYIQLRGKDLNPVELEIISREALQVIRDNSATTKLLINSCVGTALKVGAEGVHLPAGSPPAFEIRATWQRSTNREPLVGVSAHSITQVQQAECDGASFAVLAPIFEKVSTDAKGIGLEALHGACAAVRMPVLALGGVDLSNASACLDAGAAGVAGIRLFQQGDVSRTVKALRAL